MGESRDSRGDWPDEPKYTASPTITERISGKKLRVVFQTGRDLNIFDVKDFNVDGSWWRITDGNDRLYVVDPAKVNYTEQK